MSFALRFVVILFALLGGALPARAGQNAALERGAAIIDPLALRELDRAGFGLGRFIPTSPAADAAIRGDELFALPSMAPVRAAIDREFDQYIAKHRASLPNETIGVGDSFDFQLFDRALLYSPDTRFVLAGIVNRMDRAYVDEAGCGEIRLIYRLTRTSTPGDAAAPSRLPMTLNVVLRAKGDHAVDRNGVLVTCAEIAGRWLAVGDEPPPSAELAKKLLSKHGPLDLIGSESID